MSPEDALQTQIEAYRRMTPDEGLKIGLELTQAAREKLQAAIFAEHPEYTTEEFEHELRRRWDLAKEK
jgi:hypothetical protein